MLEVFMNFLMIFGAISLITTTFSLIFFLLAIRKAKIEPEQNASFKPKKNFIYENNILPFKK